MAIIKHIYIYIYIYTERERERERDREKQMGYYFNKWDTILTTFDVVGLY